MITCDISDWATLFLNKWINQTWSDLCCCMKYSADALSDFVPYPSLPVQKSAQTLGRFKKKKNRNPLVQKQGESVCSDVVRLHGLVECVVASACREWAGCEWPSGSLDKDTPLQLICTLRCRRRLKRDIWKTADHCDKGGYDSSFSLAFLSSFASIPPAHSVSVSSLRLFQHPSSSVFHSFYLSFLPPPALPPLLVMAVLHTSVQSAKCHITETEISTWNDGEGEGAPVLLSSKVLWALPSIGLFGSWWQETSWGKSQTEPL